MLQNSSAHVFRCTDRYKQITFECWLSPCVKTSWPLNRSLQSPPLSPPLLRIQASWRSSFPVSGFLAQDLSAGSNTSCGLRHWLKIYFLLSQGKICEEQPWLQASVLYWWLCASITVNDLWPNDWKKKSEKRKFKEGEQTVPLVLQKSSCV